MKLKLTSAVLALAAATFVTQQAHAQIYTTGDLLLGFSETGGLTPASNDYLVDIGPASTFLNAAPGSSFALSLGNLGADLSSSSLFGSGWASNSSVQWGVVGAVGGSTGGTGAFGLPSDTLFLTTPEATPGVANAAPLTERVASTQKSIDGAIDGSLGTDYEQGTTTSNSSVAIIEPASNGTSWATLSDSNGVAFKYGPTSIVVSNYTPSTSVLDLYELQPHSGTTTPGTYLGYFSLSSSGVLDFTAEGTAAVPEPATYALIMAGMALLVWHVRRKTA